MERCDWHTFQVLTKRHQRMQNLLAGELKWMARLRHAWFGVSVENREDGLPRIDTLRTTPARVKFLSIEPLLEELGEIDLAGIDWVIVGGESGHGARPMKEDWVLSILEQCRQQDVPFFFKQWGGPRRKAAGRELRGRIYSEQPITHKDLPEVV